MAEKSETLSRFLRAADEVAASGKTPTLRSVMLAAGGGSMRDVTEAMKHWRGQHERPVADVVAPIPESVRSSFEALWSSALSGATEYVANERQALAAAKAGAQQQVDEITSLAELFEAERDGYKAQLDAVNAERDALAARVVTAEAQVEAHRELLDGHLAEVVKSAVRRKKDTAGTRARNA